MSHVEDCKEVLGLLGTEFKGDDCCVMVESQPSRSLLISGTVLWAQSKSGETQIVNLALTDVFQALQGLAEMGTDVPIVHDGVIYEFRKGES